MSQIAGWQVIEGKKVRPVPVLNQHEQAAIANRFLLYDAKLSTLAWETGLTQHALCALIVAFARAEGFEAGRRAERARQRLMPPTKRAA